MLDEDIPKRTVRLNVVTCCLLSLIGCTSNMNGITEAELENIQVVVRGYARAKDSLNPALSPLISIATAGTLGTVAAQATNVAGQIFLYTYGEEIEVTMFEKLEAEVTRRLSCELREAGHRVSLGILDRGVRFDDWEEFESADDFYHYLESQLKLNESWALQADADAVLLFEYDMAFHERSVADYLDELAGDYAFVRYTVAATDRANDELFISSSHGALRDYSRMNLRQVLEDLVLVKQWPKNKHEPVASCSNESYLRLAIQRELQQGSSFEEITAFLDKHDIDYAKDGGRFTLSGVFKPATGRDTIDGPVRLTVYYNNDSERTFRRAEFEQR